MLSLVLFCLVLVLWFARWPRDPFLRHLGWVKVGDRVLAEWRWEGPRRVECDVINITWSREWRWFRLPRRRALLFVTCPHASGDGAAYTLIRPEAVIAVLRPGSTPNRLGRGDRISVTRAVDGAVVDAVVVAETPSGILWVAPRLPETYEEDRAWEREQQLRAGAQQRGMTREEMDWL